MQTIEHFAACMQAILAAYSCDGETLSDLQQTLYKHSEAGISVTFQLDDGASVWCGKFGSSNPALVPRVRRIGFSSIIEGSDVEVPLQWLDLSEQETAEAAVAEFNRLATDTDAAACDLWEEVNAESEAEDA